MDYSLIALIVILLPILTVFVPIGAGISAVIVLTLASAFFFMFGRSAMAETTAAVFAVGAFLTAALLAMLREIIRHNRAVEDSTPPLRSTTSTTSTRPKQSASRRPELRDPDYDSNELIK